jgi:O-antigen/teichoic acid export membrane protein
MQKKFISNLILLIVLNLIVKPISIFGIDATVQNRVGAEDYGLYFSLLNLSFLFNIVLDLGINNFTTKNIAQYPHGVKRYIGKLLSFRLVLFIVYVLITLTLAIFLGHSERAFNILYLLIFNQFLVVLIAYFRSHFSGLMMFKTDAFISVLDRLLLIFICGYFLFYSDVNFYLELFVWTQTIAYFITFIVTFIWLLTKVGVPKLSFHWIFSFAIIKKSFPFALLVLLMMIYTRSDSVFLERFHPNGSFEAGVYAQGFRLLDAFFIFGMLFAILLFPIFSKQLKDNEPIFPLLKMSSNLLIGGAIFISLFCVFNANYLVNLIYTSNIELSIPSFSWLMLTFIWMCFSLIFGTLLTANGSLQLLNKMSFLAIVLNIVLNVSLIPHYGAEGAAITAFSTQLFVALVQLIAVYRIFKIRFQLKRVMVYFFFILSLLGLFYLTPDYLSNTLRISVQLFVGLTLLFLFKLIDLKGLVSLVKEKSN